MIFVGSWTYDGNDMKITSYHAMEDLDLVDFSENPAWELKNHTGGTIQASINSIDIIILNLFTLKCEKKLSTMTG